MALMHHTIVLSLFLALAQCAILSPERSDGALMSSVQRPKLFKTVHAENGNSTAGQCTNAIENADALVNLASVAVTDAEAATEVVIEARAVATARADASAWARVGVFVETSFSRLNSSCIVAEAQAGAVAIAASYANAEAYADAAAEAEAKLWARAKAIALAQATAISSSSCECIDQVAQVLNNARDSMTVLESSATSRAESVVESEQKVVEIAADWKVATTRAEVVSEPQCAQCEVPIPDDLPESASRMEVLSSRSEARAELERIALAYSLPTDSIRSRLAPSHFRA